MENLLSEIAALMHKVTTLKGQVVSLKFSLENIADRNNKIFVILGSQAVPCNLKVRFEFLGPAVDQLISWNCRKTASVVKHSSQPCTLPPIKEFFLVLVRLRLGLLEQDLADPFNISPSTVSRIFSTRINFLLSNCKISLYGHPDKKFILPCLRYFVSCIP